MDFRSQLIAPGTCAKLAADAWLVVVAGEQVPAGLDPALAQAAQDVIAQGDFALKPGKLALLRQVAGVKAPRVVFAAAKDGYHPVARQVMAGVIGA